MKLGTVAGGGGLLPPLLVQLPLQMFAGEVFGSGTVAAKPLNADGACPPVSVFAWFHVLDHQVTFGPAVVFPMANAPVLGNAKTTAVLLWSLDGR
jgi:hypothetical protein